MFPKRLASFKVQPCRNYTSPYIVYYHIMDYKSNLASLILGTLFPKRCVGCRRSGTYFCPECVLNIKQGDLVCPFCERASIGGAVHPVCERRYGLDGLWSLGIYENPLRPAIQKIKYKGIRETGEILVNVILEYWAKSGCYLLDQIKKDQGQEWVVVPVPLHWTRKNARGFNQANLVGKLLAQKMGLEYAEILKRTKMTKSQVGLDSSERKQNIRNAFCLTNNQSRITNNILLIDDVWTTGSTLKECCYILKRNGVQKVWALTLAR